MQKLTKTEEEIMRIIWELKFAFVKDIIAKLPQPETPYNTVSSVVRILEQKGFVDHKAYGRTHEYFPIITKSAYRRFLFKEMVADYFDNSPKELVSFFVNEEKIDRKELEDFLKDIDKKEGKS